MRLSTKLITTYLGVGIIPLTIVGIIAWAVGSKAMKTAGDQGAVGLETSANSQLEAMRDIKESQITNYFAERKGDMGVLLETVATLRHEAFAKLEAVQELKGGQIGDYLDAMKGQLHILKDDPYIREALIAFDKAFEEGVTRSTPKRGMRLRRSTTVG